MHGMQQQPADMHQIPPADMKAMFDDVWNRKYILREECLFTNLSSIHKLFLSQFQVKAIIVKYISLRFLHSSNPAYMSANVLGRSAARHRANCPRVLIVMQMSRSSANFP